MKFIADFHIHSHYSIATSKELTPEHLDYWGRMKGIKVVGTGDFTHPGWVDELEEKVEPAEAGLYKLKPDLRIDGPVSNSESNEVRFILTAEISNIYKKNGKTRKTRKVHNVVFAPDIETVRKIQHKLSSLDFNITSDGRPILGLDSRDLLELCLEVNEDIFFVPAHIWTPWFSAMGAKSGFDSIRECYDDLAHHIHAVETGLSSDPPMNWLCSSLDEYTIISNSDAHSSQKLGREGNLFDAELSYPAIIDSMITGDPNRFLGTLEFFPQEGKYHHDGHRKCGISWEPKQTRDAEGICPVCGKPVTVGVSNRVMQLADRENGEERANRHPFHSIIPLKEILSELHGVGSNSKTITREYTALIQNLGPELDIILNVPLEEIKQTSGELLTEAIRRMRSGEVYVQAGYDGEFGIIKAFAPNELQRLTQVSLFTDDPVEKNKVQISKSKTQKTSTKSTAKINQSKPANTTFQINAQQQAAIDHKDGPAMVIAGPGTGKTFVLTSHAARLVERGMSADQILCVTFTNKAAGEMRERLKRSIPDAAFRIFTFHGLGYQILKEQSAFRIVDREEGAAILTEIGIEKRSIKQTLDQISQAKQAFRLPADMETSEFQSHYERYETFLNQNHLRDLDDLLMQPVLLFRSHPEILAHYRRRFPYLLVDEFQDVNAAQYALIRLLAPDDRSHLFVIGDPNQAIYGFRGADVRFIRQFREDYPNASVYTLHQSYRCSDTILKASEDILDADAALQGIEAGVKIHISRHRSDKSEAEFVARTIEQMMGGLRFFSMDSDITTGHDTTEMGLSDFAVLVRVGHLLDPLMKAFHDHSIPYQTVGDDPFYKSEPVSRVLDIFWSAAFPENLYFQKKIESNVKQQIFPLDFSQNNSIVQNLKLIASLLDDTHQDQALLERLYGFAEPFKDDVDHFYRAITLGQSADTYRPEIEAVTLMTLHASKGLEFPCVFIAGCEDGLLPYHLYHQTCDRDEERRLLYVGMTRAKTHLFLSHADGREVRGRKFLLPRSPFLASIEASLVERHRSEIKRKKGDGQLGLF